MTPLSLRSQTLAILSPQAEASRPKTRSACNRCHQQKLRCTKAKGQTSCERCIKIKIECRYSPRNARSKPQGATPGTTRRGLAPAIEPARPDIQRSVSVALAADGAQYDWLSFPDMGLDNAESLGYLGYDSAFPIHYGDREAQYILPGCDNMLGDVQGNHSLDVFDSHAAPQEQLENPSAQPERLVGSTTGRLASLNVALYECASKLPSIKAYRTEVVSTTDISHALNSTTRVAALLVLDEVFCVTNNFISVINNLFLIPGCHEAPATLTTPASSSSAPGANTASQECVAPQLLMRHRELVLDPLLQPAIMGGPSEPEIPPSATQPFPQLDEGTALLFLSCHYRLAEIYEVVFQAMQWCIDRSYAAPQSTAGTTLPQLHQVGGSGGVSFPALRVDFNGPPLQPVTASMYLALMLTLSSQLVSQSDRVVWLCEELGIDYELKVYKRSPYLAPPELKALHPLGSAPVIEDGSMRMAESGACVEYIAQTYGKGQFIIAPGHKDYADYLYWFHFANASFQTALISNLVLTSAGDASNGTGKGNATLKRFEERFSAMLDLLDNRLASVPWLAGDQLSAADIVLVCCLTTMRCLIPYDLSGYENILAYLSRVSARYGYRRARERGDPELDIALLAGAAPPPPYKPL
ncbi:hypothetical protein NUW58_g5636 [Xylaria curta]|uniref:Uncharacterized protein n=1 Tax=Xylaria curta TaxID=42375 RepID=A0ACC1P0N3_9PEZI|nr:hypothetical protein NUW58_g5636 [Xylaria curta]